MSMENIANLCRICVSESCFYSNIYDQNEMENSRLFEAINDVCQLDITEDDGLPQYICAQCERKLSEFRLFKKQSHKSKLILYSMKEKKRKVSQVEHSVKPKLEEEDDRGIVAEDYETPPKQALLCAEDRVDSALPDAKEVDDVKPYQAPNEVFIKMEPKEDEVVTEEPTYSNPMEMYDDDRLGSSSSALSPQENVVSDARGPPEQYFVRRPGGYRRPTPQKFGVPLELQEEITAVGNSSEQDFNMDEGSTNLSDDHFTDEEEVDVKPDLHCMDPEDGSGCHIGRPSQAKRRAMERISAAMMPSNGILNQDLPPAVAHIVKSIRGKEKLIGKMNYIYEAHQKDMDGMKMYWLELKEARDPH